ncbi:2Fe-2S iron-sulfur cluster-binding protein [Streptomyces sp. NPDC001985]|uniref:2Fe-2S iron-sulfur cluster-binding protein n=1 Tax=Streptomyces sp. NPDC001985 TaxID=3154406 RepID=UPI00331F3BF8
MSNSSDNSGNSGNNAHGDSGAHPHQHAQRQGHPAEHGGWQPTPHGEYDYEATAFVHIPPEDMPGASPLEAPGHGYVPPMILPLTPAADPQVPEAWQDHRSHQAAEDHGHQVWPEPGGHPAPYAADPGQRGPGGPEVHGEGHPGADPHATGQWAFQDAPHSAPGADVTGQWTIPVARGDLPEETGEFTASMLHSQWNSAPATLPGGATAPWAAEPPSTLPGGAPAPWATGPEDRAFPPAPPAPGEGRAAGPDAHAPGGPGPRDTEPPREQAAAAPTAHAPAAHAPAAHAPEAPAPAAPDAREPAPDTTATGTHAPAGPAAPPAGEHPADHGSGAPTAVPPAPEDLPEPHPAGLLAAGEPDQAAPADPATAPGPSGTAVSEDHAFGAEPEAQAGPAPADGSVPPSATPAAGGHGFAADPPGTGAPRAHGSPVTGEETAGEPPAPEAAGTERAEATEGAEGAPRSPGALAPDTPGPGAPEPREDPVADAAPAPDTDVAGAPGTGEPPAAAPATEPEGAAPAPPPVPDSAAALAAAAQEHPPTSYVLRVNGTDRPVTDAWIGESLLYVLRERLGLAGAKDGCSQGECGACNVQVDGRLVASCLVPAATAAGCEVRTVEGLATDGEPSDVQRALAACGAVQCGFCIPGMAMTVHDLLEGNHRPTELETRQALCGNLCRCSGYRGVLDAVREVVAGREASAAAAAEAGEAAQAAHPAADARIPHQAPPGAGSVQPHPHDGGMA